MNEFEKALVTCLGENRLKKIQGIKIGIAGAGGIGSNCAFNLVRSGFKNFNIADFDKIEYTNLNRQFFFINQVGSIKVEALKQNLLLINPDLNINALNMKIDASNVGTVFSDCDIIVEAFDKVVYKKLIVEEYANSEKILFAVSGIAGWSDSDDIKVHKVKNNLFIIGDLISEISASLPPVSPRVNVAAAKIANAILDYVLKGF